MNEKICTYLIKQGADLTKNLKLIIILATSLISIKSPRYDKINFIKNMEICITGMKRVAVWIY